MVSSKKILAPITQKLSLPASAQPTTPKVVGVKPLGCTVLVEMLSPNELLNTTLYVNEKTTSGSGVAPQAYVLALGHMLKDDCGVKVGDRVVVQGVFTPLPEFGDADRAKGIIELHCIKGVLEEAK